MCQQDHQGHQSQQDHQGHQSQQDHQGHQSQQDHQGHQGHQNDQEGHKVSRCSPKSQSRLMSLRLTAAYLIIVIFGTPPYFLDL